MEVTVQNMAACSKLGHHFYKVMSLLHCNKHKIQFHEIYMAVVVLFSYESKCDNVNGKCLIYLINIFLNHEEKFIFYGPCM